jgi:uncharacterized protein (DUF1684 family)
MRFAIFLTAGFAGFLMQAATAAPTPEEAWKTAIADQNKDYAATPHAMLKIQDSAYLRDGDTAVLTGQAGNPASYRWSSDARAQGVLTVALKGGQIAVTKNGATLDPKTLGTSIAVEKDVDIQGQPTQVGPGINGWRIFVFNQQNPAAKSFKGVSYFPYDPAYRVAAHFTPDPKRPARVFRTSRGTDKQFYHVGDASFFLQKRAITIPFYAASNDPKQIADMSAFFTDELTGKGTYGAGRYVDVSGFGKFPPTTITIDFNAAYNPNCARSAHFTCPIATDTIALAMNAGEKDPHETH